MLGCLSSHAQSPERVVEREGRGGEREIGLNETNQQASVSSSSQSRGATEGATSSVVGNSREADARPINASRRTSGGGSMIQRRSSGGSIRSFCKKLGKLFSSLSRRRSSSSSAASPPVHHLGLDNRTRLRNEFRQRLLGALSAAGPTFVTAGGSGLLHRNSNSNTNGNESESGESGSEVASIIRRRLASSRSRHARRASAGGGIGSETAISESDQIWREIQDFAVSQQGDVYVYIPYTHLDEALGYLSQILPLLSLSLRQQQQQQQQGLTREDFESLPLVDKDAWDCANPLDCPVCFNAMSPEQELVALPCSDDHTHIFHKSCLWKWLSSHQTCPLCRTKVEIPKVEEEEEECSCQECCHEHEHRDESQNPSTSNTTTDSTGNDIQEGEGREDRGEEEGMPTGQTTPATPPPTTTATPTSPRRIFIWSTSGGATPAMLVLSRGQR